MPKTPDEAEARRLRSIAILRKEKVPFLDWLPNVESEAESHRRTSEEVALRSLALAMVAAKGEGADGEILSGNIEALDIADEFTPNEKKFIKKKKPTDHERAQFVWRYACIWVLLWSLGFIKKLGRPDAGFDTLKLVDIMRLRGREKFFQDAKLRPQAEILDAADLTYRYHWACVDARINNRDAPADLIEDIVQERHYALNWLINDWEWDEVDTST